VSAPREGAGGVSVLLFLAALLAAGDVPVCAQDAPVESPPIDAAEETPPPDAEPPPLAEEPSARVDAAVVPAVRIENGTFVNQVHHFRFPLPALWRLKDGASGEEMEFVRDGCEECTLRVLVSPGNNLPLADTIGAIRERITSDPNARIVGEERLKLARQDAYTVVKEERSSSRESSAPASDTAEGPSPSPPPVPEQTSPVVRTRFVTFNRDRVKYYFVLRGPGGEFPAADVELEQILAKLRFASPVARRLGWSKN
jgi:hypothetical protein